MAAVFDCVLCGLGSHKARIFKKGNRGESAQNPQPFIELRRLFDPRKYRKSGNQCQEEIGEGNRHGVPVMRLKIFGKHGREVVE